MSVGAAPARRLVAVKLLHTIAWAFFAGFTLISLGIRLKRLQAVENGLESRSDETK